MPPQLCGFLTRDDLEKNALRLSAGLSLITMERPREKDPIMVAAGYRAAHTRKWALAQQGAARTARWATTMTKWLITHSTTGKPWRIAAFTGPAGAESAGVVDLVAMRRCYLPSSRGDFFEMLFIQVKGGGAPRPKLADLQRLRRTAAHHRATAVILCEWKKGDRLAVYRLRRGRALETVRDAWVEIDDPAEFFCSPRTAARRGRAPTRSGARAAAP